ncbi:enoyl-CoA hydratase/isomerase family protein [Carbonactinospora thermoautotrophica]|uniref:Enoyl-CoA hydratase n=1 Tax=Carbonactinospora thermoautotrophica TaxID=1469144 RepID=A0A132MPZ5_9ACTN|nr:enoyl-CoA hydratase/isomerase family protein [Carbonactinospora thermoautotrophica]KWW99937.1 Enoyl-CoA hydratase [Carbonactinospora thermoautotrophica]MCX9191079.1 enoyl-CoA hydratase/isomerase family protein [Carbonactinospora thermoautotrophica]
MEGTLEPSASAPDDAPGPPGVPADLLAAGGVRCAVEGAVATVTLARPERRNAQTPETWQALAAIGRALPGTVRVVVLRGEGPSFSAGLDLSRLTPEFIGTLARQDDAALDATLESYQEAFTWWRRPDLVSIASVAGHAVGAGFQLALACDLRVVADDVRFAMRETSLGLVPDLGGTKPLVDCVGYARALEICATGRWIDAKEAQQLGLATLVVPPAELAAATQDLVAAVLAAPRDAVVELKALLQGAGGRSYDEQRSAERAAQIRRLRDLAGLGE